MHPRRTLAVAALPGLAVSQRLTQTSISDAQAAALKAPLASYIAGVEASPSFAQVVAEVAQATARPDSALSETPSAANFPALAEALNAVADKDPSVVGGIPADAQQFLAEAAQGEIAVIQSVLAENGGADGATGGASAATGAAATGYAASAPASASAAVASGAMPSGQAGSNATHPNGTGIVAPMPSAGTHVQTGGATSIAATMGLGGLAFVIALLAALA